MSTKVDEVDDDRPSVGLRHYACCTYLDPHDLFRDKVFALPMENSIRLVLS